MISVRKFAIRTVATVALVFGMGLGDTALAEVNNSSITKDKKVSPSNVLRQVVVDGNQRIEAQTIISYMAVTQGETITPEVIDSSIKALFATGFFSDVQVTQNGDVLNVKVRENPSVNQVIFEGQKKISSDKLEKEVQIKPRSSYSVGRVQADTNRLLEVYRRSGFFGARVEPKIKELPQNRVDVIFEIKEGSKTGVSSVNFVGNKAFPSDRLKDVLATKETKFWRVLSNNDNYDPDKLEYDKELLTNFYMDKGYYDFHINSAIAELSPNQNNFAITFNVNEGAKYRFGDVSINTNLNKLKKDNLNKPLTIKTGEIYQRSEIEKSMEAITYSAGAAGYAFVDVKPREVVNPDKKTVDIVFDVNEGPRVYIEKIDIVGNNITRDDVIRRELRLSEGDAFNRVLMDTSRNRIRALGLFKDVTVNEKQGSSPDKSVVEVNVQEQPTGELAFSLGYSTQDGLQPNISFTEKNLRGRDQFLRFSVSSSSTSKNVDIRFTEPKFLGRNIAAGFDIFSTETDYLDYANFLSRSTGAGVHATFPLAEDKTLGLRYTIRQDKITVPDSSCYDTSTTPHTDLANPDAMCDSKGKFKTSLVGYDFNWDKRNDPIKPTGGYRLDFSQDIAGVGLGVKYVRSELSGATYYGFAPKWVGTARLNLGYIDGYGGDTVKATDRFFKGGQTFRGFQTAGIGPRRETVTTNSSTGTVTTSYSDSLGGKAYAIGTLELSVPNPLPDNLGISTSLFVDAGTLGILDTANKINKTGTDSSGNKYVVKTYDDMALRASSGLSIFWNSFMPLRFDFSYPVKKEKYDKTETFRFSTSTQF